MFFNDRQQKLLSYPLDGSRVKTLDKGGRKYSYLPTFDIINTLNLVFGFDGWETHIKKLEMLSATTNQNGNHVVTFSAIVRLKVWDTSHKHYIIREDNGVSVSVAKSIGEAMETSSKASISDAIKRAAKSYGNSMGNPLYDPEQRDVDYSNSRQLSKNNRQQAQQNYQEPAQLQQPQSYSQSPNNQLHNNTLQHNEANHSQAEYSDILNLGLQILEQGDNIVIIGDKNIIFNSKNILKQHSFRWSNENKFWYKPIEHQQAA